MFFYSNTEDDSTKVEVTPHTSEGLESFKLQAELLPTGNKVTQSPQLTDKIHEWRRSLIHQSNSVTAEWSNLKSATKNEMVASKEYLGKNIFQNSYENDCLLVPSGILSLGAFFCGRVLTNKSNWGHTSILGTSPTILGRIFTSVLSRTILPVALAITVFGQVTPATARNAWKTIENDVIPESLISNSCRLWEEWYERGLKKGSRDLNGCIQGNLQKGIRFIRESISEVTD